MFFAYLRYLWTEITNFRVMSYTEFVHRPYTEEIWMERAREEIRLLRQLSHNYGWQDASAIRNSTNATRKS